MLRWNADVIAVGALVTALGATIFASRSRTEAVEANSRLTRAAFAESTLLRVSSQSTHLASLSGKPLPPPLFSSVAARGPSPRVGFVIFAYTPGACERSIKDGLRSLSAAEARLRSAGFHAVVMEGADSATTKELALLLRDDLGYGAPLQFVPRAMLERYLFDAADPQFADEPSVLLVDATGRVLTGIHTDQFRPELLQRWLRKLTSAADE